MVSSSSDSDIPITAALVRAAICRISSIFGRRLLTFNWIRWIPFALKTFHSFERDDWLLQTGPGFKLMSPESISNIRFVIYSFKLWDCIELARKTGMKTN